MNGSGSRVAVQSLGDPWPNVEIEGLREFVSLTKGSGLSLTARCSSPASGATVTFGFDGDGNPYNGVLSAQDVADVPVDEASIEHTLPTHALEAGTTNFVYAKIVAGEFTRYFYAPGRVRILPGSVPSAIDLTCTVSPNTASPNFPITVSGTANYNNGGGLVPVGTVNISAGGTTWTASIQNGSYSRSISAPASAGNYQVLAEASDGAGRSGTASATVVVDPNGPTTGYIIKDFLTCQTVDEDSPYDWDGRIDAFGPDDSRFYVWLELGNIVGRHAVEIRLYRPDGSLYGNYSTTAGDPGQSHEWWRVYSFWPVNGFDIANLPGRWKLKLYIDGNYQRSLHFTMRYELTEHRMARDVQPSSPFNPIQPGNVFQQTDDKALVWLKLEQVSNPLDVKWDFYEPNGSHYSETVASSPDPNASGFDFWNDWKFWGWINIAGHNAANKCGDWTVDVFIRNASGTWDKQYTDSFRILESPSQPPNCSVTLSPNSPLPGQQLFLNVSASDNTYLNDVVVHWNDGSDSTYSWPSLRQKNWNESVLIGPFADGQRIEYWVSASDTSGNLTESSHQIVEVRQPPAPPVFLVQPYSQSVEAGDTVTFPASVAGSEPLSYRWIKDGTALSDDARLSGTATPSLTIGNVQRSDAGGYALRVSNAAGEFFSKAVALTVSPAPTWNLVQPFEPAIQDVVLAQGEGFHNREGLTQSAEAFLGRIFYAIYDDGSALTSKIFRYSPATAVNTSVLAEPEDQSRLDCGVSEVTYASQSVSACGPMTGFNFWQSALTS